MSRGGLDVPVNTPGIDEAIERLRALGASEEAVGRSAEIAASLAETASKRKLAGYQREAKALDDLRKNANASRVLVSETRVGGAIERTSAQVASLANIERILNPGVQALANKAGHLAQSIGGIGGQLADVGVHAVAGFGPAGVAVAGMTALVGFAITAEREHAAALDRTRAISESVKAASTQLGESYASVAAAANAAATAEEARAAVAREVQSVMAARIGVIGEGFTEADARRTVDAYREVSAASRQAGTDVSLYSEAQVQHAVTSGNMTEQMLVLGVAIEHSTDANTEHFNALRRIADARVVAGRAALTQRESELAGVRANVGGTRSAVEQYRAERAALAVVAAAREHLTEVTRLATEQEKVSTHAIIEANAALERGAQLTAEGASRKAKTAEQRAAALAAPSAAQVRASEEALRVAREGSDAAHSTIDIDKQLAQAQRALAFATHEVDLTTRRLTTGHHVAASAVTHHTGEVTKHTRAHAASVAQRQAATQAIQAQTAAQTALSALVETETVMLREKREALLAEADARSLLNLRAEESFRTASALARQWQTQEQAQAAANRALAASRAQSADDNDTHAFGVAAGSARGQLLRADAEATLHLTEATRELRAAQDDVNRSAIVTLEQRQRLVAATTGVAQATDQQREATRALSAETGRIKSDTVDGLTDAAKGLASGLIHAGVAAAQAGENIGEAIHKEAASSLIAVAEQSAVKALFETAEGLAMAAGIYTAPLAPAHFVAAAAYAGAAAATGVAGGVLTATLPSSSTAASASNVNPTNNSSSQDAAPVVQIIHYAPVIGGRESTDAEVDLRLDRYRDAGRARRRRGA